MKPTLGDLLKHHDTLQHYGVKGMKWDEKKEEVEEDVKKKAKAAKAQAKATASKIVAAIKKQKKAAGKGVKKATNAAGKTVEKVKSNKSIDRGLKRAKVKATDVKTKAGRTVDKAKTVVEDTVGAVGHLNRTRKRYAEAGKALDAALSGKKYKPKDIPLSKWEKKKLRENNNAKIMNTRTNNLDARDTTVTRKGDATITVRGNTKTTKRPGQTVIEEGNTKTTITSLTNTIKSPSESKIKKSAKLAADRYKMKNKKSNLDKLNKILSPKSKTSKKSKTDKPKLSKNAETLSKILSADAKASSKARRENTAKLAKKGLSALDKKTKPLRDKINKKASDAIRNSETYKKVQKAKNAVNERISSAERKRDNTRSAVKERVSGIKREHENTKKAIKDRVSGMKREHENVKSNIKKKVNGLFESNGSSKRRKDLQNLVSNLTTKPKKKTKIPNNPKRITR